MTTPNQPQATISIKLPIRSKEAHPPPPARINTRFTYLSLVNSADSPPPHHYIEAVFAQAPRRYAVVYVDDILIFSATTEHAADVYDVLGLIKALGIRVDSPRSVFGQSESLLGVGGEEEDVLDG